MTHWIVVFGVWLNRYGPVVDINKPIIIVDRIDLGLFIMPVTNHCLLIGPLGVSCTYVLTLFDICFAAWICNQRLLIKHEHFLVIFGLHWEHLGLRIAEGRFRVLSLLAGWRLLRSLARIHLLIECEVEKLASPFLLVVSFLYCFFQVLRYFVLFISFCYRFKTGSLTEILWRTILLWRHEVELNLPRALRLLWMDKVRLVLNLSIRWDFSLASCECMRVLCFVVIVVST